MEEQFKVDSVYATVGGEVMRLEAFIAFSRYADRPVARAVPVGQPNNWREHAGGRFLDTGRYVNALDDTYHGNLIPGELEFRDGEWLPITAGAVVEEKKEDYWADQRYDDLVFERDRRDEAMKARDLKHGPAKPYTALAIVQAPKPSANKIHAPINGLCLSPDRAAADHRLGGRLR